MSFMLTPRARITPPVKVNRPAFTEEYVSQRIPEIREKILSLSRLINRKSNVFGPITQHDTNKIESFKNKIVNLRKERLKIMHHLPKSLKTLAEINDLNILGFEQALKSKNTIMVIHDKRQYSSKPQKLQCHSTTLKGKRCSRKGTSECGKYCKKHNPALAQVRKINHTM